MNVNANECPFSQRNVFCPFFCYDARRDATERSGPVKNSAGTDPGFGGGELARKRIRSTGVAGKVGVPGADPGSHQVQNLGTFSSRTRI